MVIDNTNYNYGAADGLFGAMMGMLIVVWVIALVVSLVAIIAQWKLYKKAGRPGWAVLIPFYNTYVLFDIIYGNGWRFLLLLIPFFNIYVLIKAMLDLAHVYGQSTAFGVGLIFFQLIFMCILAFGSAEYIGTVDTKVTVIVKDKDTVVVRENGTGSQPMSDEDARAAWRAKMRAKSSNSPFEE